MTLRRDTNAIYVGAMTELERIEMQKLDVRMLELDTERRSLTTQRQILVNRACVRARAALKKQARSAAKRKKP